MWSTVPSVIKSALLRDARVASYKETRYAGVCKRFKKKYGMDSDKFMDKLESGVLDDRDDYFDRFAATKGLGYLEQETPDTVRGPFINERQGILRFSAGDLIARWDNVPHQSRCQRISASQTRQKRRSPLSLHNLTIRKPDRPVHKIRVLKLMRHHLDRCHGIPVQSAFLFLYTSIIT